ncbi:MAG: substrate-binding domain-containing protein [Vicinamibacterales bacterium]|nr:sugar ABC transporter substrate-binding protein [Acidobacteriota bacterium]MDP7672447.1 substrate-binding domain-containing protein [Vicinamibacterales bacterium]
MRGIALGKGRFGLGVVVASLLVAGCGGTESGGAGEPERLRIAVVPKGTSHDFWKSIHAGALRAEEELGNVEVIYRGPEREDNRDQQISLVQNLVSSGVDAIVLAPLDEHALVPSVRLAMQSGIPVVVIDSGLAAEAGTDYVSYVATDNVEGGRIAGRQMGELLEGRGRVLLLRHAEGSESTMRREEGFVEALATFPDIELVDPQRYSGVTTATAQVAAESLLTTHDDVDGIFCANESSTFGMLLALRSRELAGEITFIGFDANESLVAALAEGELAGLVVQNPMGMGYEGVRTAVAHLQGAPVDLRQDTGVRLATRDNMNDPEIAELLTPDLARYLEQ